MKNSKCDEAFSAGGVVWRNQGSGIEIVIGYTGKDNRWGLPKGTVEKGESFEEAAIREVQEETGLIVRMGEKVGIIEYWFNSKQNKFHKYVHHWLMEPVRGKFSDRDYEFDDVVWKSAKEAYEMLTFKNEREILEKAEVLIKEQSGK